MLGEIILKLVEVLMPDDVRQMKAAGLGDEVRDVLDALDELAVGWRSVKYGETDSKVWDEVQIRLNELWVALCEG